jgi:dihydrofolate synthase/folylpolyglutamate synthase
LDVAHNPHAARVLAANLASMGFYATTWAIWGMLQDKDRGEVVAALQQVVDHWLPVSLPEPRGCQAEELTASLAERQIQAHASFDSPRAAYEWVKSKAQENDRIVVFGSFLTVADVL